MYRLCIERFGLLAITLFWAACATEPDTTTSSALELGSSSADRTVRPAQPAPPAHRGPIAASPAPGGRLIGFYDMQLGGGASYQVAPVVAGGGTAINIDDPSAAALANLNVLWVNNPGFNFPFEYVSRLTDIAAAVQNGMILVIHDRTVSGAANILPNGSGFSITQDFSEATDINIRDGSTQVTAGLDNFSLDGGNFSNHGFAAAATLPAKAKLILSSTSNDRIVTFCYPLGKGAVIYSSIPLDFYLQGFGVNPPQDNLTTIYAPNVVKYSLAGACSLRTPRPTPNKR